MSNALASLPVVALVLLIGSAADFDVAGRTAFALGICVATIGYLVGDWVDSRVRPRRQSAGEQTEG